MNYPITTLDQLRPILIGLRKSRGLSQAGLAAKLGVAQQTYAQLEANPASASVERLFKVLSVLGVELELSDGKTAQADYITVDTHLESRGEPAPSALVLRESLQAVLPGADLQQGLRRPKKREAW